MKKMYKIKVTYLEGKHKGKSYLLGKGGHVFYEGDQHWEDDCYATLASAKRVCAKYKKEGDECRDFERNDEKYRVSKGFAPKEFYIYHYQKFEPYEVEASEF